MTEDTGKKHGGEAGLLHGVVGGERDSKFVSVGSYRLRKRRATERAVYLPSGDRRRRLDVVFGAIVEAATQLQRVVLAVLL